MERPSVSPQRPFRWLASQIRWERLESLFAHALTLDEPQRAVYLREQCASDPALWNELNALLASDDKAENNAFLDVPIANLSRSR